MVDLERRIVTPLVAETAGRTLAEFGPWAPGDTAIAYVTRDSAVARIEVITTPSMRAVAYVLDTTMFVRPFAAGGAPVRIAPSRGHSPRRRADSRELFYLDSAGDIMAVPMRDGGTPAGLPQTAVAASSIGAVRANIRTLMFEPAPDGKSFHVAFNLTTGRGSAVLTLLTNWWKHAGVAVRR